MNILKGLLEYVISKRWQLNEAGQKGPGASLCTNQLQKESDIPPILWGYWIQY